jgi:hypothetical protein
MRLLAKTFAADSDQDALNTCADELDRSFRQFMVCWFKVFTFLELTQGQDSVIFFIADQTRFIAQQNAEILAGQGKSELL